MKKLFFIISVIFISVTPSFADLGPITFDVFGAYVDTDDLKAQTGLGGGLGLGITDTISLQYRMFFTEKIEDANLVNQKKEYEIQSFLFGVEYVPVIPFLEKYQLSWNSTLLVGMVSANFREEFNVAPWEVEASDDGYQISFWTGPHFDLTQYISFFIEIGYNYCIFANEMEKASVQGFQALVGARCTLFGSRDYTEGY